MKYPLLILILGFLFRMPAQKSVSADEFEKMLKSDKKAVCIDLRTPDEIKKYGKIPGAMEIDWLAKDNEQKINALDKKKNYYVYCAGGGRSADAMEWMLKNGFHYVVNLEKGFTDWKKNGKKIEETKQ
jgi:rhodanese-related sulfurtransferase